MTHAEALELLKRAAARAAQYEGLINTLEGTNPAPDVLDGLRAELAVERAECSRLEKIVLAALGARTKGAHQPNRGVSKLSPGE